MDDTQLVLPEAFRDDLWLLTIPQVAQLLQTSVSSVRRKIRAGVLPCIRLGPRQVRVLASDLKTYIESRRRPPCSNGKVSE
jgi:excisionase family DNA binding protein